MYEPKPDERIISPFFFFFFARTNYIKFSATSIEKYAPLKVIHVYNSYVKYARLQKCKLGGCNRAFACSLKWCMFFRFYLRTMDRTVRCLVILGKGDNFGSLISPSERSVYSIRKEFTPQGAVLFSFREDLSWRGKWNCFWKDCLLANISYPCLVQPAVMPVSFRSAKLLTWIVDARTKTLT